MAYYGTRYVLWGPDVLVLDRYQIHGMARIARAVNGYLRHVVEDPEWGRILLHAATNLPKRHTQPA